MKIKLKRINAQALKLPYRACEEWGRTREGCSRLMANKGRREPTESDREGPRDTDVSEKE